MIEHAKQTDDMNIECLLFETDGEFRVRVRDLDVGENILLVKCLDRSQAEAKYAEVISTTDPLPSGEDRCPNTPPDN